MHLKTVGGTLVVVLLTSLVGSEAIGQEVLQDNRDPHEGDRRFKNNLGLYQPNYGIYDEILERTEPGPESLREILKTPQWLIFGGEHRTRYETLDRRWRAGEHGSDQ